MSEDISNTINTDKDSGQEGRRPLRMHTPFYLILAALVVLLILFAVFANMSKPYDITNTTYINFVVNEGDTLDDVAESLAEEGIVGNAASFAAIAKLSLADKFRPGTYYLSPSMSAATIARTMHNGITTSSGFTIPAGYSLEQISSSLERDGVADKEAFLEAASDVNLQEIDFIGRNDLGAMQVEGFLFPGSYKLNSDADESMLVMTMLNQFNNFFNEDYRARADELELSIREIVHIASIIETETAVDKEKAAISSVIHNKYNLDMISEDELMSAPLCSPGPESIIAALYPEENDNIYYVLSPKLDGTHVFTADETEYETMLAEYKEAMENRNRSEDENSDEGDGETESEGE